jgi:hypothetical protein
MTVRGFLDGIQCFDSSYCTSGNISWDRFVDDEPNGKWHMAEGFLSGRGSLTGAGVSPIINDFIPLRLSSTREW